MTYQHLLLALDPEDDCTALITKAKCLASGFGAQLSVVSVVRPPALDMMPNELGMGAPPIAADPEWSNRLQEESHRQLMNLCAPLGVSPAAVHVVLDHVDTGILDCAERLAADLIVVGHREHSGFLSGLLSHTDQHVVSKARCDVLAVSLVPQTVRDASPAMSDLSPQTAA
jgi:universal stress protein A